ncbi:hypothetical protein IDH50_11955 [Aeromicrobium tamlense]|uniref:DUF2613 family protein n=3 Tax=Aeromicrobium TaxID=2040 RepID=A0A8I0G105_9ACTN|nr:MULTISPECIES: hypothetical protein [Aeromicrobium]MBA4608749.1 hypothetical protein [Aeromicrobium phoceense]MBD1270949.1 hypothetical protein [Aeromicrobium tamlense]NYI38341.1 hypothetical protein [Aeromicrobium tamlense]SKB03122.1 hypothetical protein SAMN06295964_0146 [Aeromicrobium choanae]
MSENAVWTIGGSAAGIILGILAVLGIVASQTAVKQDQTHSSVIAYDES